MAEKAPEPGNDGDLFEYLERTAATSRAVTLNRALGGRAARDTVAQSRGLRGLLTETIRSVRGVGGVVGDQLRLGMIAAQANWTDQQLPEVTPGAAEAIERFEALLKQEAAADMAEQIVREKAAKLAIRSLDESVGAFLFEEPVGTSLSKERQTRLSAAWDRMHPEYAIDVA